MLERKVDVPLKGRPEYNENYYNSDVSETLNDLDQNRFNLKHYSVGNQGLS
jgi:hypothetical protein